MVRFIIWIEFPKGFKKNILHSNMVRFIMQYLALSSNTFVDFTFQYG